MGALSIRTLLGLQNILSTGVITIQQVAAAGSYGWTGRALITSPADGNIRVSNAANTNSYTITLGGGGAAQFSGTVTMASIQVASGNTIQFDSGVSNNYFARKNGTGLQLSNLSTGVFDFVGASSQTFSITVGASNLATFSGPIKALTTTVASLPAAGTAGRRAFVTDATAPVFGTAVTGGGAVSVPVYDTGAAWFVG